MDAHDIDWILFCVHDEFCGDIHESFVVIDLPFIQRKKYIEIDVYP